MPFPRIGQALVALAIVVTLLGSHSSAQTAVGPGLAQIENTQWRAIAIEGTAVTADRIPTLEFERDGVFSGTGGCNQFKGQAELSDTHLIFPEDIAATLMACPPELEEVEDRFLNALQRVETYAQGAETLVLLDNTGAPVLTLKRAQ